VTDDRRFRRLRIYNVAMGALHALSAALILILANDFALPVTATFLEAQPGAAPPALDELFDVRIAWGVAAFAIVSALAHCTVAAPGVHGWYVDNLRRGRNYARWIEYSVSASIMVVLIAMLAGVSEVTALGALFGVNAAMILFGLLQEKYEEPGGGWLPFVHGSIIGAVPWVLIALYLWSPTTDASPPGFVYGIFVSLFLFFNSFAVNMWLQYRRIGPWRDYLFGESAYIFLSLTAKTLLAWWVFASTLAVD